ncbi:SidJ-related pseudokinase [Maridesulfovibrio ferrireducens]|uniref:SidJ-related pseudokinase n=1 Tax=Maridesulfovibrio ferrireducens TaxID=246191 RepID=UPI001A1C5A3B|nr:SidJ-related pseudokinase [Maridesulfovibrio ferrireducens]MBI9109752.1 SidJ-related pseudokinase [Maridesulfovibrio ferrireducens]
MKKAEATAYARGLIPEREFCAAYMDLRNLRGILQKSPDCADYEIIKAVWDVIIEQRYSDQTMSRLLYRECSKSLAAVGASCTDSELSSQALSLQVQAASTCSEHASIEASGGLGVLPFELVLPDSPAKFSGRSPSISWNELLKAGEVTGEPVFSGRSAVIQSAGDNQIFTIKIARAGELPAGLHLEGKWMEKLFDDAQSCSVRFDCPRPFSVSGQIVFKITDLPEDGPVNLHKEGYAMAYHAHSDYFVYPNDDREGRRTGPQDFLEIMSRNSYIMGWLAGRGIVHDAPIPLFHNRVQAIRRTDEGVYQWHRFGRLDRWLESCRFPNFGLSGLRDFEHLQVMKPGSDKFYRAVGSHFMSILLVIGSWFRAQNPELCGLDENDEPVDARALFDPEFFEKAVMSCFGEYYRGFTGIEFQHEIDLHPAKLVKCMIDEMGVDQHMFEVMRVVDQDILEDQEFRDYLLKYGMAPEKVVIITKGEADIPLVTGPHLGDFNGAISLPEIIEWSAMAAGCCIAAKSLGGRWGGARLGVV